MRIKILQAGTNLNHRTYTKETLEKIVEETKTPLFGYIGTDADLEKLAFSVSDLWIENNTLYGNATFFDTQVKDLNKFDESHFASCGYGSIDKNGLISNYTLTHVAYTMEPSHK